MIISAGLQRILTISYGKVRENKIMLQDGLKLIEIIKKAGKEGIQYIKIFEEMQWDITNQSHIGRFYRAIKPLTGKNPLEISFIVFKREDGYGNHTIYRFIAPRDITTRMNVITSSIQEYLNEKV